MDKVVKFSNDPRIMCMYLFSLYDYKIHNTYKAICMCVYIIYENYI